MSTGARRVCSRGLTSTDKGKRITVNGQDILLRDVEHFDGGTVLTVLTTIEISHDVEVIVHD